MPDIAFFADSLLAIQKGSRAVPNISTDDDSAKSYQKKHWHRTLANNVNTKIASRPARGTRGRSRPTPAWHNDSYRSHTTVPRANFKSLPSMLSISPTKCDVCYNVTRNTTACPLLLNNNRTQIAFARSQNEYRPQMTTPVTTIDVSLTAQGAHKRVATIIATTVLTTDLLCLIAIRAFFSRN